MVEGAGRSTKGTKGWRRWFFRLLVLLVLVYLPALTGFMELSVPSDYILNLGSFSHRPELEVPTDGVRRLVVLKHGIFRSAASLWKLERALRDHGYEVLNLSYASRHGLIEEHAKQLRKELDAHLEGAEPGSLELYFAGHSMGGLLIRSYLSRPGARPARACVFIATPHRGAFLAKKHKDGFYYRVVMGGEAAMQLAPGDKFYLGLARLECDAGVIYGGLGDGEGWSREIPGDDDGTVGADEALLPEAVDAIRCARSHTLITIADGMIFQVLHFLKHRTFQPR